MSQRQFLIQTADINDRADKSKPLPKIQLFMDTGYPFDPVTYFAGINDLFQNMTNQIQDLNERISNLEEPITAQ